MHERFHRNPVREFCRDLHLEANWAAHHLEESLKTPREGSTPERMALWFTVALATDCQAVQDHSTDEAILLLGFVRQRGDAATQYDAEAAIRTIPRLASVEQYGYALRTLPNPNDVGFEAWCDALGEQAPTVLTEWHAWLEAGRRGDDDAREGVPNGAVLAVACTRLFRNLGAVLSE